MSDRGRHRRARCGRSRTRGRGIVVAVMACVLVSGCSSPYDSATSALQDWLEAVADGDPAACSLETADLHDELLERHVDLGGPGTECADRVRRMEGLGLPPPDAEMDVPVWDPSGEALVEVSEDGTTWKFWMMHDDDDWLVAGQAD